MEQADSLIRQTQYLKLTSFSSFIAFLTYILFLTPGTTLQGPIYAAALAAMAFHISGIRLRKFMLISLSWLLIGIGFTVSWILFGQFVNYLTVFLWATLLIASFDVSRFAATIGPVTEILSSLRPDSVNRFRKVVRHYILTTALLTSSTLFSSIIITEFSTGFLTLASPILGIAIFAPAVIILIAMIPLRVERSASQEDSPSEIHFASSD